VPTERSRRPPATAPRPTEPIAAGRAVAAKYACGGCHVLDDRRGGDVGRRRKARAAEVP